MERINDKLIEGMNVLENTASELPLQCCNNSPAYRMTFEKDHFVYLVCSDCSKLPYWSEFVLGKDVLQVGKTKIRSNVLNLLDGVGCARCD